MNKKKLWSEIDRMCEACVLFSQKKLTIDQVHNRIRGQRRTKIILSYPNVELGHQLYALSCDFFTWFGDRNDIIEDRILSIANYLHNSLELKAEKELENGDTPVLH